MAGWCRLCLRRWIRFLHRPYDGIPDERPYNDEDQRVHEIYGLMILTTDWFLGSTNPIWGMGVLSNIATNAIPFSEMV